MVFHSQTTIRWEVTISSPHYGIAEQLQQPGDCPLAFDWGDHIVFFTNPLPRQYPKHRLEDNCPPPNGEQKQGRRNRFWRFCKSLIQMYPLRSSAVVQDEPQTRQMYPSHDFAVDHDEPHPPPPYEFSYADQVSDVSELPTQEPSELAGVPLQSLDRRYITGQVPAGYLCYGHNMSLEQNVPRALEPEDKILSPLSLNTLGSAPSLMSGQQSHTLSPVSPVTVDNNISFGAQPGSGGDFGKEPSSSFNVYSPSQIGWTGTNATQPEQNYDWQGERFPPAMTNLDETSAEGSFSPNDVFRGNNRIEHTSWASPNGVATYNAGSTASFSTQDSIGIALPPSRGPNCMPVGVYEPDSEGRWHRSVHDLERNNAEVVVPRHSPSHTGQLNGQQQLTTTLVEDHEHIPTENGQGHASQEESSMPTITCSKCDKTFSGKYRNSNMKRHVRGKHMNLAQRTCLCGKRFERSDALRKHEWDKHRMPSAEPKTRAKS